MCQNDSESPGADSQLFSCKKEFSSGIVEGFNNKAKLTIRKSYGFRSDKLRDIALYHTLGNLPVPEITHRFV
ncbi:MAG: transposase [Thermodesulfobacteriota bacterium]|nr:transposase [Thermodesulfobacteriota bacterium]